MAEPFISEIRIFSFGIVPQGWAPCDGQQLSIQQNQALFTLLGTHYGGNGVTTFGLPNLQGKVPIHPNSNMIVGQTGGEEIHTLLVNELPAHSHRANAGSDAGSIKATGNTWGTSFINSYTDTAGETMKVDALAEFGNNQPHENMQPYSVVQYCIAVQGIWPPRN
jgi:microcystin-dependent protein